ncbi:MAG: hypothetical protein P4L82_22730 [Ancalomicrobiaceae bacterium]|nr:hypothetical protein [Ancalomicrobiaceae bacterium]
MLAEVVSWLITPCRLDYRRLGYLGAAISLWARGNRCRAAWRPHEAQAHAAILAAADDLPQRRTCVVLGSGLLRDVPLAALAERFEAVVLVDVVHLWPARLKALRFSNVRFVASDLTGATDFLMGRTRGFADPLIRLRQDARIDLVVSATCLTQLPLGPEAVVQRWGRPMLWPADAGRRIVAAHLDGICRLPGRICLITDTEVITRNRTGEVVEREDLLEGRSLPAPDRSWEWTVAPFGEYASDEELVHPVNAYLDFRRRH